MLVAATAETAAAGGWAPFAHIAAAPIDECSGIVASRRFQGVYWVHNDSGDAARFFAIDLRGKLLAEIAVDGADAVDWEDIAIDDSGQLYLGDFGNNRSKRRELVIYVVDEPDPRGPTGRHVPVKRRLDYRYPDQPEQPDPARLDFDCEAMFWRAGSLYLLTKHRSDLRTTLYRLDPTRAGVQMAARLGETEIGGQVTAADCSRDGRQVVVLSYQYLHIFDWPDDAATFLPGRRHSTLIEARQCEGVCFDAGRVLFTNEQREIYCLSVSSLWTRARYIPDPPRVTLPRIDPHLDGLPGEWPPEGRPGRLVLDRYVETLAADSSAVPIHAAADSTRARAGWCEQGVLVYASWRLADWRQAVAAGEPVAWFMLGPELGGRPCLERDQWIWSAVPCGDSLVVTAVDPEPGQPRCDATVVAVPRPAAVTRRRGARVDLEVLLPAVAGSLSPGGELLLDTVLLEVEPGRRTALGWSAALDMQPLGNPLLWGRARLEPGRGASGSR